MRGGLQAGRRQAIAACTQRAGQRGLRLQISGGGGARSVPGSEGYDCRYRGAGGRGEQHT